MRTKVFISQSGERSQRMAAALKEFVGILTHTDLWTSQGIPKGEDWPSALARELKDAGAGMACLTPENRTNPWILFEVGVLSHTPSNRVWTVLLDLKHTELEPPLGWRQHTDISNRDEVLAMIESINDVTEDKRKSEDLRRAFNRLWPQFETDITQIRALRTDVAQVRRDPSEVLEELLAMTRAISSTSRQTEKLLAMQHLIYQAVLHEKAPALAEMRSTQEQEENVERLIFKWLRDHDPKLADYRERYENYTRGKQTDDPPAGPESE